MAPSPARERLDILVVQAGLAPTREKARALIMAGRVRLDGQVADKPGTSVKSDAVLTVEGPAHDWVGRGGVKLDAALTELRIDVDGRTALDVGASTGGFTHCLLVRGARRVYAIDVGRGQLDWTLRNDPRVVVCEGLNARQLGPEHVPEPIDIACADLAFISLRLVLTPLAARLAPGADLLVLVKPQFELARSEVGRGVVRDPEKHGRAIARVAEGARAADLRVAALCPSPITGAKGNREFFLLLRNHGPDLGAALERAIERAVQPLARQAASKKTR